MTVSINLAWWMIPAAVTVLALLWTFFWPADDSGFMGGIARMFMLVPALFVSLLAWAIAGALK
jgi:hypothetical protein